MAEGTCLSCYTFANVRGQDREEEEAKHANISEEGGLDRSFRSDALAMVRSLPNGANNGSKLGFAAACLRGGLRPSATKKDMKRAIEVALLVLKNVFE